MLVLLDINSSLRLPTRLGLLLRLQSCQLLLHQLLQSQNLVRILSLLELLLHPHSLLLLSHKHCVRIRLSKPRLHLGSTYISLLSKHWVFASYLSVVLVYKLLDYLKRLSIEFSRSWGEHFLYLCQEISTHIFVSVVHEYISGKLLTFESLRVNEMAEVSARAAHRAMVVTARDCSIVAWFYEAIRVWRAGRCRFISLLSLAHATIRNSHLRQSWWNMIWLLHWGRHLLLPNSHLVLLDYRLLGSLGLFEFVSSFEFFYFVLGKEVELLVLHVLVAAEYF